MIDTFEHIMYTLGHGDKESAIAMYKALDSQSKLDFIDWLDETYFYEQFDNDDFETLPETIAMFQLG
jgi:hypothetical protein